MRIGYVTRLKNPYSEFFSVIAVFLTVISISAFATDRIPAHPHLYEFEINGRRSYLLGTIHLHEVKLNQFDDSLIKAIQSAEVAFGESPNNEGNLAEYIKAHRENLPVNRRLSPGAWRRLDQWIDANIHSDRSLFLRLPPGVIMNLILDIEIPSDQLGPNQVGELRDFDGQIEDQFRQRGTRLINLDPEFYEFQSASMYANDTVLNSLLMEFVGANGQWLKGNADQFFPKTDRSQDIGRYLSGNTELEPLRMDQTTPFRKASSLIDLEIRNRHVRWLPAIVNAAKRSTTFAFFGSDHLYGENGMIALLRKQGIPVVRVNCEVLLARPST